MIMVEQAFPVGAFRGSGGKDIPPLALSVRFLLHHYSSRFEKSARTITYDYSKCIWEARACRAWDRRGCLANVSSFLISACASARAASTSFRFLRASMPMSEMPHCLRPD